jgi:hypothetical protein
MQWTSNKFITTLGISIVLAFGMISVIFGMVCPSSGGGYPGPAAGTADGVCDRLCA